MAAACAGLEGANQVASRTTAYYHSEIFYQGTYRCAVTLALWYYLYVAISPYSLYQHRAVCTTRFSLGKRVLLPAGHAQPVFPVSADFAPFSLAPARLLKRLGQQVMSSESESQPEGLGGTTRLQKQFLSDSNLADYNPNPQQFLPPNDADVSRNASAPWKRRAVVLELTTAARGICGLSMGRRAT
eukprot:2536333-Rhodomonas_salina.1